MSLYHEVCFKIISVMQLWCSSHATLNFLCQERNCLLRQYSQDMNYIDMALFFKIIIYLFIYLFGCVGSSFLCEGFLQLRQAGATLHRGARASHYRGLSRCGAQTPDAQAQQLWLTGLVAPRHVGSSQTRARTCVPCISRQILNHCAQGSPQTWHF